MDVIVYRNPFIAFSLTIPFSCARNRKRNIFNTFHVSMSADELDEHFRYVLKIFLNVLYGNKTFPVYTFAITTLAFLCFIRQLESGFRLEACGNDRRRRSVLLCHIRSKVLFSPFPTFPRWGKERSRPRRGRAGEGGSLELGVKIRRIPDGLTRRYRQGVDTKNRKAVMNAVGQIMADGQ